MIYLGADHGGFHLKEKVKDWLTEKNISFVDCGAYSLDISDDYPDFATKVSSKVINNSEDRGILFCRSGSGMVIAANKTQGIRAALLYDVRSARHARENDDINIASLSGEWLDDLEAIRIVETFLSTEFLDEERHKRRIDKISRL